MGVRVNHAADTVEVDLENTRAPLVFLVAGRPQDLAQQMGRTVYLNAKDACDLSVALMALAEAQLDVEGEGNV